MSDKNKKRPGLRNLRDRRLRNKKNGGSKPGRTDGCGRRWLVEDLGNCFCFSIDGTEKEIYIEFDEILARGEAYADREPLNVLELLKRLEEAEPDFAGLELKKHGYFLERKRQKESPGLLWLADQEKRRREFFKDDSLKTFNFHGFYFDYLPKPGDENKEEESDG